MSPFRARADRLAVALVLVLVPLAQPGLAHVLGTGPNRRPLVELSFEITEGAVVCEAHIPLSLYLERVLGVSDLDAWREVPPRERAKRTREFLHQQCPVRVDGVAVRPSIESDEVQLPEAGAEVEAARAASPEERANPRSAAGGDPASSEDSEGEADGGLGASLLTPQQRAWALGAIQLRLVYETEGKPSRVSFVWTLFGPEIEGSSLLGRDFVVAELKAFGRRSLQLFHRREPEITWHSLDAPLVPDALLEASAAPPEPLRLPILGVVLLGGAFLGAFFPTRRRVRVRRRRLVRALFILGVISTLLDAGWWPVEATLGPDSPVPDAEAAREIFESRLRGIYRAFDREADGSVFEALAESVDGPWLETVYTDVYRSLILREAGGATCKIQKFEIIEAKLEDADSAGARKTSGAEFRVRARWRLEGLVRHWGHTHERTKEFRVLYTLAPRAGQWKIVRSEILEGDILPPGGERRGGG